MSSCAYLTDTAALIHSELGSPSGISISAIQTRLVSNAYLGQLNNLTQMCYSGISGYVVPPMGLEEQAIYTAMYLRDYYATRLNQTLNGTDLNWTTLREGDSQITRSSPVEQAKVFKDMQRQLNDQLNYQVAAYRTNPMQPRSVELSSFYFGLNNGYSYNVRP